MSSGEVVKSLADVIYDIQFEIVRKGFIYVMCNEDIYHIRFSVSHARRDGKVDWKWLEGCILDGRVRVRKHSRKGTVGFCLSLYD